MAKDEKKAVAEPTPAPTPTPPPVTGTAVGAPANTAVGNWRDDMAKHVVQATQTETPTASSIGLRAGILTYGGQAVPDNKLQVVILDSCLERTYYEGKFDPDNIRTPVCFALAKSTERNGKWDFYDIKPDEKSTKMQHETCAGCPQDKWGSGMRDGKPSRGKACQERRRLIMIPAHKPEEHFKPDVIIAAEVAIVKTPVTSVKFWGQYVNTVAQLYQRAPFGVITELSTKPHRDNQFELTFKCLGEVPDAAMQAVFQKLHLVQGTLLKGYDPQEQEEKAAAETGPKKY